MQKGSLVGPDRLRFDFTHDAPLEDSQIEAIEDLANSWIERNAPASVREMSYPEAIESGAVAIFDEKYGDVVRVVQFGDFSTELCGGTHARATGEIGLLKILSESGIASGVRRIEALTGLGALNHLRNQEKALRSASELLRVSAVQRSPPESRSFSKTAAAQSERSSGSDRPSAARPPRTSPETPGRSRVYG